MAPRVGRATLAGLAALLVPLPTYAQDVCNGRADYVLQADPVVIVYGPVSQADIDNGTIQAGTVTVSVVPVNGSTKKWQLCVQGPVGFVGPPGKDIADVEWQVGGSGWMALSTTEQYVADGKGSEDVEVQFRVAVGWDDAPGDYAALLRFVVAKN